MHLEGFGPLRPNWCCVSSPSNYQGFWSVTPNAEEFFILKDKSEFQDQRKESRVEKLQSLKDFLPVSLMFLLWWNAQLCAKSLKYVYWLLFDHDASGQRANALSFVNYMLRRFCRWFPWCTFSLSTSGDYILTVCRDTSLQKINGLWKVDVLCCCRRLFPQ